MEEVTTSNLMLSTPSTSRSILREEALAAWRFKPKDHDADTAWIFEASQRDMEIVTRALERELNSRPDRGVIIKTSNEKNAGPSTSEVPSSSISSCDPGSPSQASDESEASTNVEGSDPRTRTPPAQAFSRSWNNQRSIPVMNKFIGKKPSRKRKRALITIMRADRPDFPAMVQQMTGFPHEGSDRAAPSLLKPRPKRPSRIGSNITPSAQPKRDSLSLGLPVAINGLSGTRSNYLNPEALRNNLAENSVYSAGSAASISSHCNSMAIDKVNTLQSHINAFPQKGFLELISDSLPASAADKSLSPDPS